VELERLVTDAIREEVYYREALALGLDVDDTVVRQRLIEKMRELTENVVDPVPADTDLEAWFAVNRERFRIPELVSFDHIFFSPEDRGDSVVADAETALEALRRGVAPDGFGDRTPLSGRFEAADAARVRTLFDDALAAAVFAAEENLWIGPFESGFGWHVVRVTASTAARDPAYAEVEERVRDVYAAEQLARANAQAFAIEPDVSQDVRGK
jgi:parvulin-like peptidyl-prolyl isomerase